MQRLILALVAVLVFTPAADARGYYRSVDRSMVHGPTRGNQDYGRVTARCGDGSRSFCITIKGRARIMEGL